MTGYRRKVMIVDDEPLAVESLLLVLETLQVECVGAASGADALDKFRSEDIGLVITDVRMPGMSGLDLLMLLKDRSPDLPIVLISGYNIEESELENATARADLHLSKPYQISDIVGVVNRFL